VSKNCFKDLAGGELLCLVFCSVKRIVELGAALELDVALASF
jgi:hypothetical protein